MPVPGAPGSRWIWDDNSADSRRGTYRPEPWSGPDEPSVNWDPYDGGHWDLVPGDGGPKERFDRWGNRLPPGHPTCPTKRLIVINPAPAVAPLVVLTILYYIARYAWELAF